MHRALQIPELVELAFAQLISAPAYREPDDRSTLARAAGTSRAWMELALARLWNELHNLVPLLRLLGPLEMVKTLHNDDEEPFLYLNEVVSNFPLGFAIHVAQLEPRHSGTPQSSPKPGFASITTPNMFVPCASTLGWNTLIVLRSTKQL